MDSPNSDLSEYASDEFPDDVKGRRLSFERTPDHEPSGRPSKRPRLHLRAGSADPPSALPPPEDPEVSEDTDGSVPASPHHPGMSAGDDEYGQDQVTACKWDGCDAGDLGNMDNLVEHLHEDHIGVRQKKYSCEWSDCSRKGIPHASGYALRAHMRSHTREKPFYCTLPECDRSFTRSDALAKHMRTVHETEALRPSDPVPKHHSSNPQNKFQRLRLVLNKNALEKPSTPASPSSQPSNSAVPTNTELEYAHNNVVYMQDSNGSTMVQFPPDMNFTERELQLPAPDLFRLLRRQLHWAQQDAEELKGEAEKLEKLRKEEWVTKELALENMLEGELASARRRRVEEGVLDDPETWGALENDIGAARQLEIKPKAGKSPWWREEEWTKKLGDLREGLISKDPPPPSEEPVATKPEE